MKSGQIIYLLTALILVSSHLASHSQVTSPGQTTPSGSSEGKGLPDTISPTNAAVISSAEIRSNLVQLMMGRNALAATNSRYNFDMPQEKAVQLLISTNADERFDAAVSLDRQQRSLPEEERKQLVQKLMDILDSTNSDEVKVYAVVVLGEYRASEAVPDLVHHLEWDEKGAFGSGGPSLWAPGVREEEELTCPVSSALMNIGLPAIPALLNRITETDDSTTMDRYLRLCRAIEGAEVTQFRLQGLLERASDQNLKDRIQSALDTLKAIQSGH